MIAKTAQPLNYRLILGGKSRQNSTSIYADSKIRSGEGSKTKKSNNAT